ncbi:hypothetical protein N7488_009717 [Penicillium malachiteum]|nr:hypothetical protein N7488_009717 [Penicillium malachiteum]
MSSEFTLQKADIVTDDHNPFGSVSLGRLFLKAKVVKLPVVAVTGKPRVKRKPPHKFLMILFNYTLWSETDEYIAHLFLDWDAQAFRFDKDENAPGPFDEISMLLTTSTFLGQNYMFETDDISNQDVLLGLLIRPTGENGDYERLGIWYTEDRDLGGPKFWKDVPYQDIKLV